MTTLPPPADRLRRAAQAMLVAAVVAMVGVNLFYGAQIVGERLPMQWGLNGAPNWFGPRVFSLWGLVVITAVVGAGLVMVGRHDPSKPGLWSMWLTLIVFAFVMAAVHVFHVASLLRWAGPSQ